jgi:hypothetical protein
MDVEDIDNGNGNEVSNEEYEREARNMGWLPKEQFTGKEDDWVDAKGFVEKGQHVIPILRANNKRLQRELLTRDQKIGSLEKAVQDSQKAIETLEKHYSAANKRAIENAKRQLVEQIKDARENGDTDAEFRLLDQLDAVKESAREAEKKEEEASASGQSSNANEPATLSPEFERFQSENSWFGSDKKRTKSLLRIAEDLRDEGETAQGYDFMQMCLSALEKQEGNKQQARAPGKVEGGRSGRSGGQGKSFSDLPAEAKQACWEDVDSLVGKGKRYETKAAWEKRYAEIYFGEA